MHLCAFFSWSFILEKVFWYCHIWDLQLLTFSTPLDYFCQDENWYFSSFILWLGMADVLLNNYYFLRHLILFPLHHLLLDTSKSIQWLYSYTSGDVSAWVTGLNTSVQKGASIWGTWVHNSYEYSTLMQQTQYVCTYFSQKLLGIS